MKEFEIRLTSVQDVQEFVACATAQPFTVSVWDRHNRVNGKSFLEMFCLNFSNSLNVEVECDEGQFRHLLDQMHQFMA